MILKVARLVPEAKLPTRKNKTDAGLDFYSIESIVIHPHSSVAVGTGITVEVPLGYMFLLKPKGSSQHDIGAGVVDSGYEPGEIKFKVINYSDDFLTIEEGQAVGQGVLVPVWISEYELVDFKEIDNKSERSGKGGILGL